MQTIMVLIIVHMFICILLYAVKRREKGLRLENLMPLVAAVPVFGPLCFGIRLWEAGRRKLGGREVGLDNTDIMKGRYRKIKVEENADMQVVPLEEALLVNNAKVRHSLMLNILHSNPNEYVGMLQKARNSEDMEVTHYATTMMMELLTEYENKIQEFDRGYRENPRPELVRDYILYLQEFIDSRLVAGNIERIYRERLAGLIEDYAKDRERIGKIIFISIENYLLLGRNDEAKRQLEQAEADYPDDERMFRLYGHYYDSIGDFDSMQEMVRYIRENNIYLSRDGREWLAFWTV